MRPAGVCKLPSLFLVGGYRVFFWSNENGEPIHVHVCKGVPSPNATKLWLTREGGCIVSAQFLLIFAKWKECFAVDEFAFYC